MYKYASWVYIIGELGRILLLLISIKMPKICRSYFSYQLVMLIANSCMVSSFDTELVQQLLVTMSFLGLYSEYGACLVWVTLC